MSLQFYKSLKNEIDTKKYLFISASYGANITSTQVQYINSGFGLYIILPENSTISQQIKYNPEVKIVLDTALEGKTKGISYKGIIEKVTDKNDVYAWRKKFTLKFRRFKNYFFHNRNNVYEIKPIEIKRILFDTQANDNVLTFKENEQSAMKILNFKFNTFIKLWIQAVRLAFVTSSFGSVFLGAAIAWSMGFGFNLILFLLTLLGTFFVHSGANMINDFYGHITGNDAANYNHNKFTGGSRIIQNGVFSPEKVLLASLIFLGAGSGIGFYLNAILPGNLLLLIGFIGIFLCVGYSTPVLKLSYRGLGELSVGIAFGFVITLGSFFVQAGEFHMVPLLAAVPLGILVFLILYINEFQDYRADKNTNKKTLVVLIGDKWKAIKVFNVLIFLPYVWIAVFCLIGILPLWSLITFLTLPLAIIAVKNSSVKYRKIYELLIVNKLTIGIHFLTAILISLAFVLDKIV